MPNEISPVSVSDVQHSSQSSAACDQTSPPDATPRPNATPRSKTTVLSKARPSNVYSGKQSGARRALDFSKIDVHAAAKMSSQDVSSIGCLVNRARKLMESDVSSSKGELPVLLRVAPTRVPEKPSAFMFVDHTGYVSRGAKRSLFEQPLNLFPEENETEENRDSSKRIRPYVVSFNA